MRGVERRPEPWTWRRPLSARQGGPAMDGRTERSPHLHSPAPSSHAPPVEQVSPAKSKRKSANDHEPPDLMPPRPVDREQINPRLDILPVPGNQIPRRLAVPGRPVVVQLLHEVARERVDLDA